MKRRGGEGRNGRERKRSVEEGRDVTYKTGRGEGRKGRGKGSRGGIRIHKGKKHFYGEGEHGDELGQGKGKLVEGREGGWKGSQAPQKRNVKKKTVKKNILKK